MKIALDISPLETGHGLRGTGSYTKLLIEALQKYEDGNAYYFFTRGQKVPKEAQLVHYPYFDPFFLTLPLNKPKPVVVTVHDIIPIAFPSHFPRGIKGEIKWQIQKLSLHGAKEILTDSMSSKLEIVRLTGILADRVNVVYLAPAEIYKPIKDPKLLQPIALKYKLPKRYLLYVGDVNWNKNLKSLLKAFTALSDQYPLVLVGQAFLDKDLKETKELDKLINDLNLVSRVFTPGFIPEEDLPALYTMASVYIQPSIAEGFGLPVLEAMACGCPVVSSERSSLKEIAGPSVLVDPQKPDKIAEGINLALKMRRGIWLKEAKSWVANFSLQKLAQRTVEVYKKALS